MSVRDLWAKQGVLGSRTASASEIEAFEKRHGVVMPPVVREYFASANGTYGGRLGMDDEDQIGFWHLDQVESLDLPSTAEVAGGSLFVFADWMINSWQYAIRLTHEPDQAAPVFVAFERLSEAVQVATSFSEFLDRYVSHDLKMLFPR